MNRRREPLLWKLALLCVPGSFRARHREDMAFVAAAHLEGRGRWARTWIWARVCLDTMRVGARLRARSLREAVAGPGRNALARDLGFALRALRRRPGFTAVAVATLGLGIGACTAIFTVVNGVLMRPLPYEAADRIGILWHEFGEGAQNLPAVHPLDVVDYRDRSELFETFTLATGRELILGEQDDPELVDVGAVEAGFFEFFGVEARLGRTIRSEEDVPGADPVAVLSHRLWERRFGADPGIVGRSIVLGGARTRVVGVLRAAFRLELPREAFRLKDAEVWVPSRLDRASLPPRNFTGWTGFGRLRKGVDFRQAQAEVASMAARLREEHPVHASSGLVARIEPLKADVVKGARPTLLFLLGAVVLVLLIACANVANLVVVRGKTRASELAVRSALGAGRAGLVRLLLAESVLVAAAGAAVGVGLAWGALELLAAGASDAVPLMRSVRIDGGVLAFAVGLGAVSAMLVGIVPALRGSGPASLQGGGRRTGRRASRGRDLLMVGEVAATLVLLVGTGLMVRSFRALGDVDPGFEPRGALTFRVSLPVAAFPDADSRAVVRRRLMEELGALPRVEAVGLMTQLPLTGSGPLQPYAYDEETASNWESVTADQRSASAGLFEALGARLLRGRGFTGVEATDRGTIVIDDRLAARAFPGSDAVGERLQVEPNGAPEDERYATVVGVVEHVRLHDLARPHLTQIYFPDPSGGRLSAVVRTSGDPAALVPSVRSLVARLAPGAPVEDVRTLEELATASLAPVRLTLTLMSAFAFAALLLAAVGIYGVLSYAVSRRTREIGVRLALGQSPAEARRSVLRQGARIVFVAIGLGLVVAALLSGAARGLVYGVEPVDLPTYAAVSGLLFVVSLLACWVPARRATRVDPAEALKSE